MYNKKPNILFFVAEDVNPGDFGCYNKQSPINTKNINNLAEKGVIFTNAHSTAALCAPARYSLLTGNLTHRQTTVWGEWGFNVPSEMHKNQQQTVANLLKSKGYRTGLFGKTGIGGFYCKKENGEIDWEKPMPDGPNTWGFDYSFTIPRGHQWVPLMFLENGKPTCDPGLLTRGWLAINKAKSMGCEGGGKAKDLIGSMDYVDPNFKIKDIGENLLSKVEHFLDTTNSSEPFFMHFCSDGAHCPYDPPNFIRGKKVRGINKRLRDDMVYETDVLLGCIHDILRERNLHEDTIICFTADHGAWGGNKGECNYKSRKSTIYEGGVRVPLIVSYPNKFFSGISNSDLVCAMDIIPTITEMLNITIDDKQCLDAKSFLSKLTNTNTSSTLNRKSLIINHAKIPVIEHDEDNDWKDEYWSHGSAVYEGCWKLVFSGNELRGNPIELYNLEKDPFETQNVISEEPNTEIIRRLTDLRQTLYMSPNTRLIDM